MRKIWGIAATAAIVALSHAAIAEPMDVGAVAEVRQNVYGVPPAGSQAVKRKGDAVVFQEALETLEESSALIRFIDDSKLTLGAKSKVVIDSFVFDPARTKGNALIQISVGTLRFVTGAMPKGGVVIKTPTATLVLRGTDVVVHVHPDGTTDTTVHDGKVEAHNELTNEVTTMAPGDGASLGRSGTTDYDSDYDLGLGLALGSGNGPNDTPPEHRRSESPRAGSAPTGSSGDGGGDDSGDCGCI